MTWSLTNSNEHDAKFGIVMQESLLDYGSMEWPQNTLNHIKKHTKEKGRLLLCKIWTSH